MGLYGCSLGNNTGLNNAKKFESLSAQFDANTGKLASEIYNSCIRRIAYQQAWTSKGADLVEMALKDCNELNRKESVNAIKTNKLAVAYIQSIGSLAQDGVADISSELDEVESALTNFSIPQVDGSLIQLPASAVSTGKQISKFLYEWVGDRDREGSLAQAIVCSKEPFEKYLNGLKELYTLGYIDGLLQAEYDRMRDYYETYQAKARKQKEGLMVFRQLDQDAFNSTTAINSLQDAARGHLKII